MILKCRVLIMNKIRFILFKMICPLNAMCANKTRKDATLKDHVKGGDLNTTETELKTKKSSPLCYLCRLTVNIVQISGLIAKSPVYFRLCG